MNYQQQLNKVIEFIGKHLDENLITLPAFKWPLFSHEPLKPCTLLRQKFKLIL